MSNQVILLVDDDQTFRERLAKALSKRLFDVLEASSVSEANKVIEQSPRIDKAIVDLSMPTESGLDLIKPLKAKHSNIKVVVLTGFGSINTAVEAVKLGATNYISKPIDTDSLLEAFSGENKPLEKNIPELKVVEQEHIQKVLSECNGNISKASRILGLHRRSLQRKLAR